MTKKNKEHLDYSKIISVIAYNYYQPNLKEMI